MPFFYKGFYMIQTTCPYCGVGCGLDIDLDNQKIKGNPHHPANLGRICVKGSALLETVTLTEKDLEKRLLHPMLEDKKVSWETALTDVAEKFKYFISQYGQDSIAFYVSGQLLTEDYYVANKLMKGFIGSGNIDTNSRLCMASAVVAHKRAFGSDTVAPCYEDLEQADLVIITGSNLAWAHPIVYQRLVKAKKQRPEMKIVVIDPRYTATCDLADLHLALCPSSDGYLFNGLLSYLYQKDKLDQSFIKNHTENFEVTLQQALEQHPDIQTIANQTQLNQKKLQQFFDWVAETPNMITLFSQGINQSSSGVDKGNAIINVHLATGRIGNIAQGPFSITGQPNAMGGREVGGLANQLAAHMDFSPETCALVQAFWQSPTIAKKPGLKAVELFQAIDQGHIKAIWIMGTNPLVSLPDTYFMEQALSKCEYVVVSDCVVENDTLPYAHVKLPAAAWSEKQGTVTNSERCISLQKAFIDTPGVAKPDWWIISQVAQKMGFIKDFNYQNSVEIFCEHAALSGYKQKEITRDFDISGLKNISQQEYENFQPIQWPVNQQAPQGTQRLLLDKKFFTPNTKAQFIPITAQIAIKKPSQTYPFVLNTGRVRDQWHTMTRTGISTRLQQHIEEPYLEMHPQDAKEVGVVENSIAKVTADNQQSVLVRVKISINQLIGTVFIPMHWSNTFSSQAKVGNLIAANTDPYSGQPESKQNPVKIEKFESTYFGVMFSTKPLQLARDFYWTVLQLEGYFRYEIVLNQKVIDWKAWLSQQNINLSKTIVDYQDSQNGYRAVHLTDKKVNFSIFMHTDYTKLPDRNWLLQAFTKNIEIKQMLVGKSLHQSKGKTICSCFNVGLHTIIQAIKDQKIQTVEKISHVLKAGTNCGSCLPELNNILLKNK